MNKLKQTALSIIMTLVMVIGIVGTNVSSVFAENSNKSIKNQDQTEEVVIPSSIAQNYKNDILFNALAFDLKVNESHRIVALDTPRVGSDNQATMRDDLKLSVVDGNDVISIDDKGVVKGVKEGVATIEVTYPDLGVTGVVAANIIDPNTTGPAITTDIKENKYDILYFTENSYTYNFKVNSKDADKVKVEVNGNVLKSSDNSSYAASLKDGYNIIKISATNSKGTTNKVYNIRAKKLAFEIKNLTREGNDILEGDKIKISFIGLVTPVPKVSRIYNPAKTYVTYKTDMPRIDSVKGKSTQYNIATENSIEIEVTEAGTYTLSNGYIHQSWWGDKLNSEVYAGEMPPNTNAAQYEAKCSVLPDIKVEVKKNTDYKADVINTLVENKDNIYPGSEVTLKVDGLKKPTVDNQIWELTTRYSTDIPGLQQIKSENAKDDESKLGTIKFVIPKDTKPGEYNIKSGYVYVKHGMWEDFTREEEHYKSKLSDVKLIVKEEKKSDEQSVKVNLNVSGYKGVILDEKDLEVKDGQTVLDLLTKTLDSKNIKYINRSGYIAMIGGQQERDRGPYSGWKYSVNGKFPGFGMGGYKPKKGDNINLIFVEGFMDETSFRDIDKIDLNKSELNLKVNGQEKLLANITPKEATEKILWSTSDKDIANVDKYGNITGIKEGVATITAKAEYNKEAQSQCKVKVEAAQNEKPIEPKDYTSKINDVIEGISKNIEVDDWAALALNKSGKEVPKDYLSKLQSTIKDAKGNLRVATDYERTVIGILAAGGDPTNFAGYNLVEKIYNHEDITMPNAYIFALIALDAGNFTVPDDAKWTREKLIEGILDCRTDDNGWAFGGVSADPDMTAMALSALAPYAKTKPEVKEAVDNGIEILSTLQTDKGGFKSWGSENCNSAAMVVIGLCDNGIDVATDKRFIKNGNSVMDSLLSYVVKDNKGFGFTDNESVNPMANEQGFRALAAYKLFKEGKGSVYKGLTVNKPGDNPGDNPGNNPGDNPEAKLMEITNLSKDSSFSLGGDAKISIKATNNSDKDEEVSLIVALYDNGDQFVNYVTAKQTVKKGDSSTLTGMIKLPKEGAYKLKAFVWDAMETMNPLSDIIELPVK